jgi:hypothetical protein
VASEDGAARVLVAVITRRIQVLSTDYFAFWGLDLHGGPNLAAAAPDDPGDTGAIRVISVKSRGHFRAGFQHLVPAERVIEVDAPGLSCQNLSRFEWSHLPRPCWPLDRADPAFAAARSPAPPCSAAPPRAASPHFAGRSCPLVPCLHAYSVPVYPYTPAASSSLA